MKSWLRSLHLVSGMILRIDRWRAAVSLALVLLLAGVTTATALAQRWLVDSAELGLLGGLLGAVLLGAVAFGLSSTGFRLQGYLRVDVSHHVAANLSRDVAATVARISGVEHLERAEYLDRIMLVRRGAFALAGAGWALAETGSQLVSLGLSVWLLSTVHPVLTLAALLAVPPLYLGNRGRRLVQSAIDATAELERVESELHDLCITPGPAKEVWTSRSGTSISDRADVLWAQALRRRAWAQMRSGVWQLVGWISFGTGFVGAILISAALVADQRATIGDLVLVISLASQLRGQIAWTVTGIIQIGEAGHAIGHYQWLMDYAAREHPHGQQQPPTRLDDGITLRRVGFRYPGAEHDVLTDVDLHLPAGHTVALVGVNGAGKTTLVKLLTGMYQPTSGNVQMDGISLAELDPVAWRARITGAFQDFLQLQMVARESVGVGDLPHVDDTAAVEGAVTRSGAGTVVAGLRRGLDTQLGRVFDGVELSHGQWQRLALARGCMRTRPLLVVLDEPTAALDPQAEHDLYERFISQAHATSDEHGTITLLISHRFSTVRMADLIMVLADGRVAECGTHDQLLAAGGTYAEHFHTQARGYAV